MSDWTTVAKKATNGRPKRATAYRVKEVTPSTTTASHIKLNKASHATTSSTAPVDEHIKHLWKKQQIEMKKQLILKDDFNKLNYIGGVDISFNTMNPYNKNDAVASLIVLSFPEMKVVYEAYHRVTMNQPYIAGFLGFREVPHLEGLLQDLKKEKPHLYPDIVLVDGNGILHMRGFGHACHLGVFANVPTIGVAKKLLCVDGITEVEVEKWEKEHLKKSGDSCDMTGRSGKVHGALLKVTDEEPLYISPGHRVSLQKSIDIVRKCCINSGERIPEPIRLADLRSREAIKQINRIARLTRYH
jgi:deoxyinosine 3'endonuclease (endonuclease V)